MVKKENIKFLIFNQNHVPKIMDQQPNDILEVNLKDETWTRQYYPWPDKQGQRQITISLLGETDSQRISTLNTSPYGVICAFDSTNTEHLNKILDYFKKATSC